ncbi:glycoside hydrolase family 32 protein [Salegentibacter mishustinae]|uniref:glycoside hydrolase family 32 protein n=1 Tax=Salegentibacter mishustinae TaxID=270918 RepID=UPI001CE0BB28|nr:glycoside hydrolase family 32 protein [Salegentibacter mishustinae]UBZ07286.1 glycoside hydrolase family 32 protein [Salegentibacter mishustinae]
MKNKFIFLSSCLLSAMLLFSCKENKKESKEETSEVTAQSDTDFRPNFHFTPESGWMNDPNGMFYHNGYFHLYFQHYPDDNVWGPMHWGHAISTDMITWKEQPIALYPDEKGYIFSGSAVVDHNNTSGFGEEGKTPIIAMFTYHDPKGEKDGEIDYQSQAIAYSLDEGKTFTKYEGNPVIENPEIRDFRDPKITRDEVHDQWVMVLSADDKTMFYTSQNLKDWELASEFGRGLGAHGGVWECPDFIQMNVEGTDEKKWVLIQSLNPGGFNGGSGTQYFVGDFDGKTFTLDESMKGVGEDHSYWIDFGKDNYAGVTWANIPKENGRTLFMGWMSNWLYAQEVPTETWRSAMTIARELMLEKENDTYTISSMPVKELKNYRGISYQEKDIKIEEEAKLIDSSKIDLTSAEIRFKISDLQQSNYKFKLSNSQGDELIFGYNHPKKEFYLDRSAAGQTEFSEDFANKISVAPRISEDTELNGVIILDKTSIELFYDNGKTVITEIVFPNYPWEKLSITPENGELSLDEIEAYQLKF